MKINMDDSRLNNITQLKDFLKGSLKMVVSLEESPLEERYSFITKTIRQFSYQKLPKKEKHVVISYLHKVTGYKKNRLYQFIKRAEKGTLQKAVYARSNPAKIYVTRDIKLLEETDEVHLRLSEDATKEILRREFEVFGKKDYQTIARVSHSHITNLRHCSIYRSSWINHTKARQIPTIEVDNKGKKKKVYNNYQVPYEFLKSLPNSEKYLKPGITFENLDKIAYSQSDNEFATIMREEERKLFQKIREADRKDGSQRKT